MKKLTKQLFAAALVVAIGFTGCQKSEMDEIRPLEAAGIQQVIADACGTTVEGIKLQRGNELEEVGELEIGNTETDLILQFTSDKAIRTAQAKVNGVLYNLLDGAYESYTVADNKKVTQIIIPLPAGVSAIISEIEMKVGGDGRGYANTTQSNRVDGEGKDNYSKTYVFQHCNIEACSYEKGYWKENPDKWPINELQIGSQTYNKDELLVLLSTGNANRNLVKLAQAYTVARLNVANGADYNQVMPNGNTLGEALKLVEEMIGDRDIYNSDEIENSDNEIPGIVGMLHQLPDCGGDGVWTANWSSGD